MANKQPVPLPAQATDGGSVVVRGAREHNLKNVNVAIPRNALVVFSGVSGSGKSSLAFGTLYAEAQRRYFESVAPYARRLIDQAGVPDVDAIDGLPPAVALQQQRGASNTRSSVGSVTTLSSLVRMMYSRAGAYPPGQPMLYAEDFSPNTPQGACPSCHGLGHIYDVTEALMVPDPTLSIRDKAIASWPPAWQGQNLRDILVSLGYDVDTPWQALPEKDRRWILFTEETPTVPVYPGLTPAETREAIEKKMTPGYMGTFTGARRYVLHTFATTQSALMRKRVSRFMEGRPCPVCRGKRLKPESLAVTFAGIDIGEFMALPVSRLAELLLPVSRGDFSAHRGGAETDSDVTRRDRAGRASSGKASHAATPDVRRTSALSQEKQLAAAQLARGILARLDQLQKLGLGYLSLDRATPTLSAGELQRLRLATQLSAMLFGVVYVLDEPSAGLHPADSDALYDALEGLRDAGNSVFVVEHDLALMRRAQWLVDVGPAAGEGGGRVLYSGEPEGLKAVPDSVTAQYLFDEVRPPRMTGRQPIGWLQLRNIHRHNLRGVDADIALGVLTAVTGISGSGKSSLFAQALPELVLSALGQEPAESPTEGSDSGEPSVLEKTVGALGGDTGTIKRLVQIDQKPIGRTPRSNLATYTGLFDHVRKLFAATPEAKSRRYDAGQFSFNVAKGRCPTCEGEGFVSVELLFMPSVYAPCPTCRGARYNEETLSIRWRGQNIAQVLHMTVDEALAFFADEEPAARPLRLLAEIGLGYLRLGQPATELSGGEAQRIKLATELQRAQRGHALYILDEPTTGLHAADADRLLAQLQRLVDAGNTVVMIEHDMRSVIQADRIMDIGPGAGLDGGRVVAAGTPEQVAQVAESRTARYIARELKA
ncbi:excinuclease ABC subunit UvrA [Pluralibacter gergoviae]|uniref:excinuclease ABC subunit UvrA n=1 Tax=Pluralibacter gergoviae TaxID=61647 RepID=UPI0006514006|nr:excinuclease ABC subunit UvrA [Pluralibacter gergoviae]EKV0931170.1 excinuclease ABC subunit UvrA [Pluralibacter gergoviae]EKV6246350.1 excinuclease ABC subunit UvrA [Pluralibacter gergoviae]EKW9967602.1 excinuclease ABC subunit UvrA [Pluralibacter gergoviae]ELD4270691.1 excinuclease ABC subunit UvrA [Pluralibacter gergoviae]ELD4276446.1 excinuclease ABC subunit UvrA [Pluralibacter gergoviae]